MSRLLVTNKSFELLEPYEGKLSRTVLRGESSRKGADLLDSFRFSHQVNASAARRVDLPHTWNAQDALGGKHDYKRGIGNYTKKIFIRPE